MSIFADSILLVYSRDTNGRKTIMALTDTKVRSAKPEEKEYSLVDGDGMIILVKRRFKVLAISFPFWR